MATRPISFRVEQDVLDAIEAEGKSPTEIAKAALEREARLSKVRTVMKQIQDEPLKLKFDEDPTKIIRKLRDGR